ncbi:MAG: UbiX family flavin prenyltransferase [Candidatus Aenigmatarchaeota archaeon]
MSEKKIVLALTGASGIPIGLRLAEELSEEFKLFTVVSDSAKKVMEEETDDREESMESLEELSEEVYFEDEVEAPFASGSFETEGMVVCPCSMKTLSSLATGRSSNLIERAGDVCIKEKRKLVLVPRETPFSQIHLENMLKLSRMEVDIVPPVLGFYFDPESIDDMVNYTVGKVLERFEISKGLYNTWEGGIE